MSRLQVDVDVETIARARFDEDAELDFDMEVEVEKLKLSRGGRLEMGGIAALQVVNEREAIAVPKLEPVYWNNEELQW